MSKPDLVTVSYGGGTESSVLLLMAARGEIEPMPDCAVWADTGNEPESTHRMVAYMQVEMPFPVIAVSAMRPILSAFAAGVSSRGHPSGGPVPLFTLDANGERGMTRRFCTREFKLEPLRQVWRSLLGVGYGERVPRGTNVEVWLGISMDEIGRMRPARGRWQTYRWPLIEQRMTRAACQEYWQRYAPADAPPLARSACIMCPYQSRAEWMRHKDEEIEAVADAEVAYQRVQRERGNPMGQFLHPQRIPLRDALAADLAACDAQPSMFDLECEGVCGV